MANERMQRRIERPLDQAADAIARFDWEAVRNGAEAAVPVNFSAPVLG